MLDKNWFDRVQINWNEAPEGFISIHAMKFGETCVQFELPAEWLTQPDFWDKVHEIALEKWKTPPNLDVLCPVCSRKFKRFQFRYKGRMFCRFCGSHFTMDGDKVTITRRNGTA